MKSNQELMDSGCVSTSFVDAGSNTKFDLVAMLRTDCVLRDREIRRQRRRELDAPVSDGDVPGSHESFK